MKEEVNKDVINTEPIQQGIPPFEELRKIDLSKYIKKRDAAEYINWATIKQILHDNGAKVVYFEPIQQGNGSSLIMSDREFKDSNNNTNKVYETRVKIVIDELIFEIQGPVMNGSNPVKDNSMTQQRLWNSQTRLFVKGVAIRTGLGFDMWSRIEVKEIDDVEDDDLSYHNLYKIKERLQEIYTKRIKEGLTTKEIAGKLNKTEDEVKAIFSYFDTISNFEKELHNLKNDSK